MAPFNPLPVGVVEVKLDGVPVELPAERHSFAAIRSCLESLALKKQRILCGLIVDGQPVSLTAPRCSLRASSTIEGETMSLNEVSAQLINAALQQTENVHAQVQSAVELVLINDTARARELWWELVVYLKEPLLTLALLPDNSCVTAKGSATITQLRQWQLEQLGRVIEDVDECCDAEDPTLLSDALEKRVLPWLDRLSDSLKLWLETVLFSATQHAK